jgi:alpha-tubulin suppressor-like RCC1 family protein
MRRRLILFFLSLAACSGEPPTVSVSVSPSQAAVGESLTCLASASDPDGDSPGLSYRWSNASSGVDLGAGQAWIVAAEDCSPGDAIVCEVTAVDPKENRAVASASATVLNSTPSVDAVSISPGSGAVGDTLVCEATGTDPDGDELSFSYSWYGDSAQLGEGDSYTVAGDATTPGEALRCVVLAVDPDGGEAEGEAHATVDNTDPVVLVSISPPNGEVGDTLECIPEASDVDLDELELTFTWSNTATVEVLGTEASLLIDELQLPGEPLECTVTATDPWGGAGNGSAQATVDNSAPTVDSVEISPSSGAVGETLDCSASASDINGDEVSVSYAWTNQTSGESLGTGASWTITGADSTPGDVIGCTAIASDPRGGGSEATATATVDNSDPRIDSFAISPSSGRVGDILSCLATASDPDGDEPSLAYSWTNGSTVIGSSADLVISAADTDPGDTLTCTVDFEDPHGGHGTSAITAAVLNSDPSVTGISITPSPAYNDDTLVCTASVVDADDETPSVAYAWTNTSTGASLGAWSFLGLSSSSSSPYDVIQCSVTATDGYGGSGIGDASVALGNRLPSMASVAITPTEPGTEDLVSAEYSASDDDDDEISVSWDWYVDGVLVQRGIDDTLDGGLHFDRGQEIVLAATPSDPYGSGSHLSSRAVFVVNTPPEPPTVSILDSNPIEGEDDLVCVMETGSRDADGDPVTYTFSWLLDGAPHSGATASTAEPDDTIPAALTEADQVWTCQLVPDDGWEVGEPGTAEVTVAPLEPFVVDVAAGGGFSMVLSADGRVWAWGDNYGGVLATGDTTGARTPVRIEGLPTIVAIAAGYGHAMAIDSDGALWTWGSNSSNQLGRTGDHKVPTEITTLGDVVAIAAGQSFSMAVTDDGSLYTWGRGYEGQLGHGDTTSLSTPTLVADMAAIVAVAAASTHGLALDADGTVWGSGDNSWGQLGDGTTNSSTSFVEAAFTLPVATLSTGGDSSLVVQDDGTVIGAGGYESHYGGARGGPYIWDTLEADGAAVASGYHHALLLRTDGSLWSAGSDNVGQLGTDSGSTAYRYAEISSLAGVVDIDADDYHNITCLDDGTVWTWGYNLYGQLGDGTTTNQSLPVQVTDW